MSVLRILGVAVGVGALGLAAFLAYEPWRTHGGRFATEFLVLAGAIGLVGAVALALGLR
jgi:NADPH-dependent curcumin reductase CurA